MHKKVGREIWCFKTIHLERRNVRSKKEKKTVFNGVIKVGNKKVWKSIARCKATFKGTGAVDVDDKGKKKTT